MLSRAGRFVGVVAKNPLSGRAAQPIIRFMQTSASTAGNQRRSPNLARLENNESPEQMPRPEAEELLSAAFQNSVEFACLCHASERQ